MTTSRSQENIAPIVRNWRRMTSMFCIVQVNGWPPFRMAAFSAGSPNASKPIGKNTLNPCMRRKRARASVGVTMYQCPMCRSPDGYGYIVSM